MTESEADRRFAELLVEHGLNQCVCGRKFDRGDVAWNNGQTEEGTEYTTVEIICQACGAEAVRVSSWWPWADDFEDLVENVLDSDDWTLWP